LNKHQNRNESTTNWFVITGGPGSGKTTTVNLLRARGYKTTIEHARHYIDTQCLKGKTVEEVIRNQVEFQMRVLEMQIAQEASLDPEEMVFLDRAIPDALAYYHFLQLEVNEKIQQAVEQVNYKKVFILDCLPLVNDYARREDAVAQKKIHDCITQVYTSLPFPVIQIPVMDAEKRIEQILSNAF
jgi:predicted ATPase